MNVLYVTATVRRNYLMRILCAASRHALTSVARHHLSQLPKRDVSRFDVVFVDSHGLAEGELHRAKLDLMTHVSASTPIVDINRKTPISLHQSHPAGAKNEFCL